MILVAPANNVICILQWVVTDGTDHGLSPLQAGYAGAHKMGFPLASVTSSLPTSSARGGIFLAQDGCQTINKHEQAQSVYLMFSVATSSSSDTLSPRPKLLSFLLTSDLPYATPCTRQYEEGGLQTEALTVSSRHEDIAVD